MVAQRFLFAFLISLPAAQLFAQPSFLPFSDLHIAYQGRIVFSKEAAELSWPGVSATIRFNGTRLAVQVREADTANYYNVIVDGNSPRKVHFDTARKTYVLAEGLRPGIHSLQLFKRTEWDKGKTFFYGFEGDRSTQWLPPAAPPKRKMEFYGNSITCGYAIEDYVNDSWFGCYENCYDAYAVRTARHFGAQFHCIAKSGIGIMLSWFPLIMPEMYDRLDPLDSTSKWDFSRYTPDIVVINLFQNDCWLVNKPDFPEFKHRFGDTPPGEDFIVAAYKRFVAGVRAKYHSAHIICMLGSMDATRKGSAWPGYIQKAVGQLNDPKIYTLFVPYKETPGHPKTREQAALSDSLVAFIEKNIRW